MFNIILGIVLAVSGLVHVFMGITGDDYGRAAYGGTLIVFGHLFNERKD
jgi:hypothetical protein